MVNIRRYRKTDIIGALEYWWETLLHPLTCDPVTQLEKHSLVYELRIVPESNQALPRLLVKTLLPIMYVCAGRVAGSKREAYVHRGRVGRCSTRTT